jgi:ferredoxin-NADP reductase
MEIRGRSSEILGRQVMWRVGTVVALHDETATARTITLEVHDWPGHVAGQHVDVRLTAPDGYSAVRSYSIASAPNSEPRVQITVERLSKGEVSPYLTQEVIIGDRLELRGPIGGWFVWRPEQTEPFQLIAGGSGIVPVMAMIRSRAVAGSTARSRLLYSVRETGGVFFIAMNCAPSSMGTSL